MSGKEKINLSDPLDDIRNFFDNLVLRESRLKIISDSDLNGKEVTFINFKKDKNLVILSIPNEKVLIKINVNDPSTFMDINSLEITYTPEVKKSEEEQTSPVDSPIASHKLTPTETVKDDAVEAKDEELEVDIVIDDIEEQEMTILQEATVWELSYKSSTLIEDIVQHLQSYYNKKNRDKDIDLLYREAYSILDLINKFKSSSDITDKTTKKHTPNFQPLLENIVSNQFLPSYIKPVVFDQKKFYTKNEVYLDEDSKKELDLKNDVIFVNEEEELKILNEIVTQHRNKKNTLPEFKDYQKILEKLYEGGQIDITNEDGENETLTFEPINRSHVNNIPNETEKITYYKAQLKNNTRVVRNCFSAGGCTVNPDEESEEIQLKVGVSTRLADGEILVIKDTFDDRFIYETKGEIKSCNSAGDKFYTGTDKTTDLNKTISRPPTHVKYIDGENVNIVGFFIQAMSSYKPNIVNGNEIKQDDGLVKKYPKLFNEGLTINDACPIKQSKLLKIIDNHEEFSWDLYNPDYNYVILFKSQESRHELNQDEYIQIISQIIPTIDDIIKIESENIDACMNMNEVYTVLNKHNIYSNQLSTEILLRYNIFGKFIDNGNSLKKYEQYLKNRIVINKDKATKFMKLDNILIQFKNNIEKGLLGRGNVYDNDTYIELLKDGMMSICEPIFRLYSRDFLRDFVNDYQNIMIDSGDKNHLINVIINKTIIMSDSIYANSEFTKYFTNPEELISPEYQTLFNKYLLELNIPVNPFSDSHINHFDKNILKHLDFIKNMRFNNNNSHEILEIINLNNLKKLSDSVSETMTKYGETEYNNIKNPDQPNWNELSQSEKLNYIPNYEIASELRQKARLIKQSYLQQKAMLNEYINKCKSIRIMKEYNSLEDLIYDNNKITYTSEKYDTTKTDFETAKAIRSSVASEQFEEEFEKTMKDTYIYDSDESVRSKISTVLSILSDPELRVARKVKSGDYAIINDGKRRLLYLRRGTSWIPVDKSNGNIDTCFNYEAAFLDLEFEDIKQFCIDYKDNKETACVRNADNEIIVNKLYKLIFLHDNLLSKVNNIVKSLEYKKTITEKIEDIEQTLVKRLKVIKSMNKRAENKNLSSEKSIQQVKKVYPPKEILNELDTIKRIEDFDQRNIRLRNFISEHGVQWKTIDGEIMSDVFWWYNIPKVNVPLICTHYNLLMDSALKDTKTKEDNMRKVRDEYGILDGEFYYCKHCGEVIDFRKYSEFEGFGRDDKVINVREAVVEDDEDMDDIDAIASIPVDSVRKSVNMILRKINVDLRVDDYREVIEIVTNRVEKLNNELTNIKSFYYNFIKGVGRTSSQQQKEDELVTRFESLAGAEYSINYFRNIDSKTKDPKILKFVGLFYDLKTNKAARILKLQRGYKNLNILSYCLSALAEVIRTAIPDYTIKGSGVEKSQKKGRQASGIIINDIFDSTIMVNDSKKLWITSYLTDNMYDDISKGSSADLKAIDAFLSQLQKTDANSGNKQTVYTNFIDEKYNEVSEMGNLKDRVEDKKKYQLETYVKTESSITYDWKEFLPSLEFNNEFTYTSPDIQYIIQSQKSAISDVKELSRQLKSVASDEVQSIKDTIQQKTQSIQNKNQELREIENKIGFNLITKINNIVTAESLPDNFNPSSYTNSSNYDNIKSNYLKDYIRIDPSISNAKSDLDKIREYFTKYNYDSSIIYDILITTLDKRDLQHFMKLDPKLYQNDDNLVKGALINKIKQSHYTYNLTKGDNYGDLRYFKEINDSDYYLVTQLIEEEVEDELFESSLRDKLISKYGENYPNIDFKVKLLIEFNGKAEVDILSMQFKNDISDNINRLTMGKSIDEINEIISDIEINTNNIQFISEKSYQSIPNEINNKDVLEEKIREMLSTYSNTCSDSDFIEETVSSLISIQNGLYNESPKNDDSQLYRTTKADILEKMSPYFTFCKQEIEPKIRAISDIVGGESRKILSEISDVAEYYNELIDNIDSRLKIEDITNPEIKTYEKSFRENDFKISKFSNRVNAQISIIRYIIGCLSSFHHRLVNPSIGEGELTLAFLTNDEKEIISKIVDNANYLDKIITRTIGDIKTQSVDADDFRMPLAQFQNINTMIEKLTMFNNTLDNKGMINIMFVNNPEIMVGFTNTIIIYLISLMTSEIDDNHNRIMTPIINNIIQYIQKCSFVNNITDMNIKTILDKHRADENQARLKRFNKKDDEEKGLHNIYRKYNLGKQIVDDEIAVSDAEVGFLSVDEEVDNPILQNDDGLDDFDAEQDLLNSLEIDNIPLSDNLLEDDMEDREEYE